jgi:hypothetical protein
MIAPDEHERVFEERRNHGVGLLGNLGVGIEHLHAGGGREFGGIPVSVDDEGGGAWYTFRMQPHLKTKLAWQFSRAAVGSWPPLVPARSR